MNARGLLSTAALTAVFFCVVTLATAAELNAGRNASAIQGPARVIQDMSLVGIAVSNPQGQNLGQIKYVLLNPESGQATFVILDTSMPGHAMLVVPYQALRVNFDAKDNRQSVVLGLRAEQMNAAPRIVSNQWQVLQNPQFLDQARDFYHIRTAFYAAPNLDAPPAPSLNRLTAVPKATSDTGLTQDQIDFFSE